MRGGSGWLEWMVTFFSTWLVVGVYLDGWAHIRRLPESFFTPWHGIIYSSFLGVAVALAVAWMRGRARGSSWRRALPPGYGLSLVGVAIFLVAGVADLAWHTMFGIEGSIEALCSPPHLLLAAGGALIATGPLRSAWKASVPSRGAVWRAVLAATLLLSLFTFFTAEAHPFVHPWAWIKFRPHPLDPRALGLPSLPSGGVGPRELAETLGVGSFIIQSATLVGLILLLVRRWAADLPFGWITFIVSLNAVGLSIFHSTPWTIPVAFAGGLGCDALYRGLKPSVAASNRMRLLGAAIPLILSVTYFVALLVQGGVWWRAHVWVGSIVIAGLTGWFVSYLVVPPSIPRTGREIDAPGEARV